eukprot:COSAG01_NODE_24229_length_786_cov_0.775837_1_plen_169_part_00
MGCATSKGTAVEQKQQQAAASPQPAANTAHKDAGPDLLPVAPAEAPAAPAPAAAAAAAPASATPNAASHVGGAPVSVTPNAASHAGGAVQPSGATAKLAKMFRGRHAMLSYQWDVQKKASLVNKLLTAKGIPCWQDIDGGMNVDIYDSSEPLPLPSLCLPATKSSSCL